MNIRTVKILAGVVAILLVVYLVTGRNNGVGESELFLPGLKSQINEVSEVSVAHGGETVTVAKSDNGWTVVERDNHVADVGVLRELLIALADAKILERKTSNPEKYRLIGVDYGADESEAATVSIKGSDFEYSVIMGKTAQSRSRYARIDGEIQSVLIDQNPDLPDSASGWMLRDIVDIGADRIARITIRHSDGEEILIEKESPDANEYQVRNIPEGRELSYATVVNGIAGALGGLEFNDVRASPQDTETPAVVTTFETFEGMTLEIVTFADGDSSWIAVTASAEPASEDAMDTQTIANDINGTVADWQYKIPDYKANLLKRRFDDILKKIDE